jgi:uncharacterized protein (TIGR03066 family)
MRIASALLVCILLPSSPATAQTEEIDKTLLPGSWRVLVEGDPVTYTYEKDGTLIMTVEVKDKPTVRFRGKWRWLPGNRLEIEIPSGREGSTFTKASVVSSLTKDKLTLTNPKSGKKITQRRVEP